MPDGCDAVVVGAGVVGMTTAYALASRGLSVTIVDRADEPARGTSFANGAQLSYLYTEPLAAPSLLRRLPALTLALDPSFRLRPSLDPAFIRWGLAFLRNCTRTRFEANTLAGLRLGLESREAMHRLLERHPFPFSHVRSGKLHLLEGRSAMAVAAQVVRLKRSAGVEQALLTPAEAEKIEPAIGARVSGLSGAIYSPQEEVGDPFLFCRALADLLREQYGVTIRFGTPVERIRLSARGSSLVLGAGEEMSPRRIALCSGAETPRLLHGSGAAVPIWPMKGYSVTAAPGPETPRVSITDVARKLVFCRLNGSVRIAGLADLGSRDTGVRLRRLQSMIGEARAALPHAADYDNIQSSWAGLRPMTPNSLPIIRREKGGVVLNVGHGSLGWTYAMGAAERAAALMVEGPC